MEFQTITIGYLINFNLVYFLRIFRVYLEQLCAIMYKFNFRATSNSK